MRQKHKEEFPGRISSDEADRRAIRLTLASFIDPLNPDSYGNGLLLNIVSGKVANPEVNVDKEVEIGTSMLDEFEASRPEGFQASISKRVTTFAEKKKRLNVGGKDIVDPEAKYNRVFGLLVSQLDLNLQDFLLLSWQCTKHPCLIPMGPYQYQQARTHWRRTCRLRLPRGIWRPQLSL